METKITSDFLDKTINFLDLYFYVADLSNLTLVNSFGSLGKILGNHTNGDLKHPIEFNEALLHPKDRLLIADCVQKLNNGNGQCWSGFYRIKHADGGWVWIYSRLNVINENGSPFYKVAGMIMDVSSCISTETQLGTLIREAAKFKNAELLKKLTARELTIIKMIVSGQSYTAIARQLFIQPDTVNKHRKNILHKLGLKNITMLACFAKEVGLV